MQKQAETIASFRKLFERLSMRHSYADTFTHFLDFALYMFDWQRNPEPVAYLEKIYEPKESKDMADMFLLWSELSDHNGNGFYDVLGDMFMEFVSHGRNGQFFTPQPICDMMAQMMVEPDGKTVNDCACGSGRMLLAAAKIDRHKKFYGADNDRTCCKMAALNLIINTMPGEIAHMNSLSLEYYGSYHIQIQNIKGKMLPFYFFSNNRSKSIFFNPQIL